MPSMSREEFVAYAREMTSAEVLEPLYERIAEHNAETAQFGDSGPGVAYRIFESIRQVKRIEATLARIERRAPREFHFNVRMGA